MPTQRARVMTILSALRRKYPRAGIALTFQNPFQLLVATVLSAQCTDKRVNIVTRSLFKKYKTVHDYARARQRIFEQEIRSTGFYRNKAKNIIAAARKIREDFNGTVPRTMQELLTLPGVARKTANIILCDGFHITEGIAVDTHVKRLSGRLGFSAQKNPEKIEKDLMQLIPKRQWCLVSHVLITHGRTTCMARKPQCRLCIVGRLCPSKKLFVS